MDREHTTEREGLDDRLAQAQARAEELQATLEHERAHFTARIADLEQRLKQAMAEPARNEAEGREPERQTVVGRRSGQRLEALENELRRARDVVAAERGWRQQAEQRLQQTESRRRRAPLSRWWRRARPPCSVCHRSREGASDRELTEGGWTLTAAGALCPACHQAGWRFPPEGKVPFRRVGAPSAR